MQMVKVAEKLNSKSKFSCFLLKLSHHIITYYRIAQLVEQRARNRKVVSSNPVKAYQTFHPSKVDKLVPVVVWPSGLRRGLSM